MYGRKRRHLRRFQHHCATRRQRRIHLDRDLVERPVPRRDQPADADRLLGDQRRPVLLLELEVLQRVDRRHQVTDPEKHLRARGQRRRRADFLGDRVGEVARPLLVFGEDGLQQVQPLFATALRPTGEGAPGRLDRHVDVVRRAERDLSGICSVAGFSTSETIGPQRVHPACRRCRTSSIRAWPYPFPIEFLRRTKF